MKHNQMLLNCVASLKEVRAQWHHELNPRIAAELERVIDQLEFCITQEEVDPLLAQQARNEGLRIIALVIESVVSILDLFTR